MEVAGAFRRWRHIGAAADAGVGAGALADVSRGSSYLRTIGVALLGLLVSRHNWGTARHVPCESLYDPPSTCLSVIGLAILIKGLTSILNGGRRWVRLGSHC